MINFLKSFEGPEVILVAMMGVFVGFIMWELIKLIVFLIKNRF